MSKRMVARIKQADLARAANMNVAVIVDFEKERIELGDADRRKLDETLDRMIAKGEENGPRAGTGD